MVGAYFLDASAAAKRYIAEAGSEWVRALCHETGVRLFIASLTGAEIVSAIHRKARSGDLSRNERDWALAQFGKHFEREYMRVHLHLRVIDRAIHLLAVHSLKASDAIQLASALAAKRVHATRQIRFSFISADRDLLGAARRAGLEAENPDDHA